jgi:hypothetical protein
MEHMITKIAYNPQGYLFLDQKKTQARYRSKNQSTKFDLKPDDLGLQMLHYQQVSLKR